MAPQKVIIDTDPGVDDIFALLLALNAPTTDLQVELFSLVYGNIDVENCLRNLVTLFHVLDLERLYRLNSGLRTGFDSLDTHKPVVAIGAEAPLKHPHRYDYFHGRDGVCDVHTSHPHLSPSQHWKHLFTGDHPPDSPATPIAHLPQTFKPSARPAHVEMLEILRNNEPGTVTIIALGPMTNLSLAAKEDPATFLRAKEVVAMAGALKIPGNITPVAEFNVYSDAYAAAHIMSLTSLDPASTCPPDLVPAEKPEKTLNMTIISMDLTHRHLMSWETFDRVTASPLHEWLKAMLIKSFAKMKEDYIGETPDQVQLAIHDALCVWYVIDSIAGEQWESRQGVDVRVETEGKWTRGMTVIDQRGRKKEVEVEVEVENDHGEWLSGKKGNRVRVVTRSGHEKAFERKLVEWIFGMEKEGGRKEEETVE